MTREGSKPGGPRPQGLVHESPVGATDAAENPSISRTPTMTTPNEVAGLIERLCSAGIDAIERGDYLPTTSGENGDVG